MITEPFELNGKTIKEAFMKYQNSEVVLRMEDGSEFIIKPIRIEDEITGKEFYIDQIEIIKL